MHKKTRKGEIMPKTHEKSLTRSQKRDFWWGRVKIRRPGAFIEPVGSLPNGSLIPSGSLSRRRPDVQEYRPAV
jgi:hypothetical protein